MNGKKARSLRKFVKSMDRPKGSLEVVREGVKMMPSGRFGLDGKPELVAVPTQTLQWMSVMTERGEYLAVKKIHKFF